MIGKILKNKKGFTLIEMVVVIAVVAILMSIIAIRIGRGPTGQAYDTRRMSDLQKVQTYLELYYTKNRAYPSYVATWNGLDGVLAGANIGISSIPNDPLANQGATYFYCVGDNNQSYILGATLSTFGHAALNESSEVDSSGMIDNSGSSYSCSSGSTGCEVRDSNGNESGYCIKP